MAMIATIHSSPAPPPPLPAALSLPSTISSSLKPLNSLLPPPPTATISASSSSAKLAPHPADDYATASETMELAGAESDGPSGAEARRRKRRRRRKGCERSENVEQVLVRDGNLGFLSSREDANYSLCLKENARLDAVRRKISQTGDQGAASNQWANAAGIKRRNLDKKLCNGRESQERIVRSYKRLVVSVASSYQGRGLSLKDLIQEGSIGLLRGAERFDPERGYKLSTYVYWWIKQAIVRAIENKSRVIRLPGNMCGKLAKVAEASNSLSKKLQRVPTYEEIAKVVELPVETVRLVSERSRAPISLDETPTDSGPMSMQAIVPGPEEMRPDEMVKRWFIKETVRKLLQTLCEREVQILSLYFGLTGETPQSFEEIAKRIKLSRERVRQVNSIALSKLQQSSLVKDLEMYIF
uniref:RNA polymerase sigma-70 domain-containing protein n=1 Tax=Kalanchoe fedtschenkoi TaxID=63787 RepID=A0A7N0VDG0_KALFE